MHNTTTTDTKEPFQPQQQLFNPHLFSYYENHQQIDIKKAEQCFHQGQNIIAVVVFTNTNNELDAKSIVFNHTDFIWQDVRKVLSCLQDYDLFIEKSYDSVCYH